MWVLEGIITPVELLGYVLSWFPWTFVTTVGVVGFVLAQGAFGFPDGRNLNILG